MSDESKIISRGKLSAKVCGMLVVLATVPGTAFAENNIYLGAGVGPTENKDVAPGGNHDTGWKAFVGANASRVFGWEIGYADLGRFGRGPLGKATIKGWNADLLAGWPLDRVTPYVKVGGFYSDVDFAGRSSSNWDLKYGAGIGFDLSKTVGMRLEWERYEIDKNNAIPKTNTDMASLNLVVKLGH